MVMSKEVKYRQSSLTLASLNLKASFIYFKAKLLGGARISPRSLGIFNFATLDTYKNIALIVTYRYLHEFKLKRALINYGAI